MINNNGESALLYMTSGEVNPIVTIEKNQFKNNCRKLYGNFTTCRAAVEMDIQNTQTVFFRVSNKYSSSKVNIQKFHILHDYHFNFLSAKTHISSFTLKVKNNSSTL